MSFDGDTLDQMIFGKRSQDDTPSVIATSGDLTQEDAALWQRIVQLDPMPGASPSETESVGLFSAPNNAFILARAMYAQGDYEQPIQQYIMLPRSILQMFGGDVNTLTYMLADSSPLPPESDTLSPLQVPPPPTWTTDRRSTMLQGLVSRYCDGDIGVLFQMLNAALDQRRLLITGVRYDRQERLDLVQGMLLLLPPPARAEVTFATHVEAPAESDVMIVFADSTGGSERWHFDAGAGWMQADTIPAHPYMEQVRQMWEGTMRQFVTNLRKVDLTSSHLMDNVPLESGLADVVERLQLDADVAKGVELPANKLKEVLRSPQQPATDGLLRQYLGQMLNVALTQRDPEAVELLRPIINQDEDVEAFVIQSLEDTLDTEPDATYFFVRTYLAGEAPAQERWLELLHSAAVISLSIVIQQEADADTVMTWLKLLAREPAAYKLNDVLRDGIQAAQVLTHDDGFLGRRLLIFTAKRMPNLVDTLLADEQLLAKLEAPMGPALRDYESSAVQAMLESGRELALVLLGRAVNDAPYRPEAAAVFTPPQINLIWELYLNGEARGQPSSSRPDAILERLIDEGHAWLPDESLNTLFQRIVVHGDTELFLKLSRRIPTQEGLQGLLVRSLRSTTVKQESILNLVFMLTEYDVLSLQQATNVLIRVAGERSWNPNTTQTLVESIARTLQQNGNVTVSYDALQRMLDIVAETKAEMAARTITRRMLVHIEAMEDQKGQTDAVVYIQQKLQWSNVVRTQLMTWWRAFSRTLPLARLQQLDKNLSGRKDMERARSVVRTTIALRKMVGKRSLDEFAEAVNTAYTILQALSESFDINRQEFDFDQYTVREELEARASELTPDERSVLAKNLQELAELITAMADNRSRSRAKLVRRQGRQGEIERQLLTGEQKPQSAIDTMRWLAGYLSGLQDEDKD